MIENATVLIVDDSALVREMLRDVLERSGLFRRFLEAGDGEEALRLLADEPVDLVLCDLKMPGMDGFACLDRLRAREELADLPVILLTGQEDREDKIAGLERGASDYVTKPFDPGELLARVKVQLKVKSLQDRLKESNRRFEELSLTDPLTGLRNRRHLMESAGKAFERSRREGSPLALAILDLDHFKAVNDNHGHPAGDRVLVRVGGLLRENLRPFDLVARFGGEEFAMLLPATSLEQALAILERLRYRVGRLRFPEISARLAMTVSIGVAALPHPAIAAAGDLFRRADQALYRAKHGGRDRVETDTP